MSRVADFTDAIRLSNGGVSVRLDRERVSGIAFMGWLRPCKYHQHSRIDPVQVLAWQGFFVSNGKTIADTAAGAQDTPTAQQLVDPGENRPAEIPGH